LSTLFRTLGILLLLVVVALTSAVLTMHFAIHGAEVTIPDLKGSSIPEAHQQASALGLDLSVENRLYSSDVAAGHVLNQSPAPGTVVRAGWPMRLTESLGPQKVTIPALTGKDDRIAALEIRRAGLQPANPAYLASPQAPEGTVLAQSPEPDAAGVENPIVHVLLAAPADPSATPGMVMPSLIGKLFPNAALTVTRAGLKLAPVKSTPITVPAVGSINSNTVPAPPVVSGSVLAQNPPAGYRVQAGDTVTLTVAR
jgi:eukaryotic-like serine/threonine-protein kinase